MIKNLGPDSLTKVMAAVIEMDGKVLIARRRKAGCFGGLWEFPGGKLQDGEDPERGLEREIMEELGVRTRVEEFLCSVPYRSPALSIELLAYRVVKISGEFKLVDHDEVRWAEPAQLDESLFSEPDRTVVRLLISRAKKPKPGLP